MELFITRPTEKKSVKIVWLDIDTPVGNFVIQPEHAPMVITLKPESKITYCLTNGKQESIDIRFGVVHVTRKNITLLING